VVLWRISDFIRNRRWSGLSTRMAGLGHPRPQRKTFNHPRRSLGGNGPKSNFIVYEEESPQKHSVMYIVQNLFHRGKHHRTISLNGSIQKLERCIADHGLGASNVSPKDELLFGSLRCSHCSTPRLFSHQHETRDTGHIETKKSYLSRGETDSVRQYLVIYPSLSKINSVLREI
jgi:hypothetical protein